MAESEVRCVRSKLIQQQQQQPMPNNWLDLPSELVELIMKKLNNLVDIIRFKAVCSSWYKAGNNCRLSYSPTNNQSPWLMLPTHEYESHTCFFNFAERKVYKLKNVFHGLGFDRARCVGSSYGWLIIFDRASIHGCLLNPFSGDRIDLPSTAVLSAYPYKRYGVYIRKAILSSDPTPPLSRTNSSISFSIVIMYGIVLTELAFYNYQYYKDNNNKTWTKFVNGSVEVWDFDDEEEEENCLPKKVATFNHPDALPLGNFPRVNECCYRFYLAKSLDNEILYVFRLFEKVFTNNNDNDNVALKYKDEFHVYKLDYCGQTWEKIVQTFGIDGQALFLGENQCI
ncbi:F-box protein At2g05970-like [Ziziphus jujuba]|uniref:F-box protein At2g05970-like n=1 Tax=Ziziphus jujuba TaxID=326968 RepID=A0ABM4A3Y0_ZIZJJ|nr:F-box protein At2g05970-like [Ziziphus jujuba]